ncbi:hypothetical protein V6N11_002073 [Hibiscus sabdariffa]|uniref:Uncharacterized protein n=1 Tax=Hibiscus sabdariffa TaxID=183260 RepID=A0ABR2QUX9_9ROSI
MKLSHHSDTRVEASMLLDGACQIDDGKWWSTAVEGSSFKAILGCLNSITLHANIVVVKTIGNPNLTLSLALSFPFSTKHVRESFVAALGSNSAAAAQAHLFKLANEGHLNPRD